MIYTSRRHTMLVLHMGNQIVISLDPFLTTIPASRYWAVEPLGKVD